MPVDAMSIRRYAWPRPPFLTVVFATLAVAEYEMMRKRSGDSGKEGGWTNRVGGFLKAVTGSGGDEFQGLISMKADVQGMEELSCQLFEDLHEARVSMKQVSRCMYGCFRRSLKLLGPVMMLTTHLGSSFSSPCGAG